MLKFLKRHSYNIDHIVAEDLFKYLSINSKSDYYCLFQYIQYLNTLRQKKSLNYGLEIGVGYSTFLTAQLVRQKEFQMYSIDTNLQKLKKIGGKKGYSFLNDHINLIHGQSISFNEFNNFYNISHKKYANIDVCEIKKYMNEFIMPYNGNYANNFAKQNAKTIINSFFEFDKLKFNKDIINIGGRFDNEYEFLKNSSIGKIDELLQQINMFDFIFFDASEYSSLIEWEKLKGRINIGGFAIFHDIYFPKSLKNFIPAASILADTNWNVKYKDVTTIQGLLIAERIR